MMNSISKDVSSVIYQLFSIEIPEERYAVKLTNPAVGLNAMQLVYLLCALEEKYGTEIDAAALLDGRFNSVEGIAGLLAGGGR